MTDHVQNHILNNYNLIKKVGSGAYGHVWKVTDKKTNQVYALKKIFDAFQHSTDAQRTYRQIMFLHQFKHSNIIKLINLYKSQNDKDLYLIFQFMQADLHNAIGQKILKDIHNRYIFSQIIKGIKYLHSAQVIHRDLKPSNILINSQCGIKICDFGLARSLMADQEHQDVVLTEEVATRWYRAPQILLGSTYYGKQADVWSIGCILAEILTAKPLFQGNSTLSQLQKILSFTGIPTKKDIQSLQSECAQTMIQSANISRPKPKRQWFKSDTADQAIDLVVRMLQFNPHNRITVDQILRHPYISQFRDSKTQVESRKSIRPPISDNKKLTLKQYRTLIYESIDKMFRPQQERSFSIQKKTSLARQSSSVHRQPNSIGRNIRQRKTLKTSEQSNSYHYSSSCKNFYNSSLQKASPQTPSYSSKKLISSSQTKFYQPQRATSFTQDEKRKNTLKDLLRQRKAPTKSQKDIIVHHQTTLSNNNINYNTNSQSVANLLNYKNFKNSPNHNTKENRFFYAKA